LGAQLCVASFAKSPGFVVNLEGALGAAGAEERAAASDCLRVLFATGQHNDELAARALHEGLLDAMLAMLAESGADYSGARRATTANLVAALKSLGQNAAHANQVSFCKHFTSPPQHDTPTLRWPPSSTAPRRSRSSRRSATTCSWLGT